MSKIKVLLVYPIFSPPSYWGGDYALPFIGKLATMPPLGLLTIAAMFPEDRYELKLVDMNVEELTDDHLAWAHVVMISAWLVQKLAFHAIVMRCQELNIPVVAGGPYPTEYFEEITGVTHFVLGEVENYFTEFLADFEAGQAKHVYQPPTDEEGLVIWPDLSTSPLPRFDLIKHTMHLYNSMCIQYSRGCPYDCHFCNLKNLCGPAPRVKTPKQVIAELELLYNLGWRKGVFFGDDNFIGNIKNVHKLLPVMIKWMRDHNYPFFFDTEVSVNLAFSAGLPEAMIEAGFISVFIGIETTNPVALKKINKPHNIQIDNPDVLLKAVHFLQSKGFEVSAGFIIGLDSDCDKDTFDRMFSFVMKSGIPTAMVGLLIAPKNTKLYSRYEKEGRLLPQAPSGDNVSISLNYVPEMDPKKLIAGYKHLLSTLYEPKLKNYYKRCWTLMRNLEPKYYHPSKISWQDILALFRIIRKIGLSKQGLNFMTFVIKVALYDIRKVPMALGFSVKGYHYQKITAQIVQVDELNCYLKDQLEWLKKLLNDFTDNKVDEVRSQLQETFRKIQTMKSKIHLEYYRNIKEDLMTFQRFLENELSNIVDRVRLKVPTFVYLD